MAGLKISVAVFCMLCSICFGYDDSQTHVSTVGSLSLKRSGRDVEDQGKLFFEMFKLGWLVGLLMLTGTRSKLGHSVPINI